MAGYTQTNPIPFVDGQTITASLFVNEFNSVQAAFDASSGHDHNGVGEGAPITVLAADALTFGANSSSDVVITFNTSGNDGTLTWDQSESTFDFGASGITTTGVFEAGNIDVNDITANGLIVTSNGDDIELDAGSGRVIVNATHTNSALTLRSTAASSANDGPELRLVREPDTTANLNNSQVGAIKFQGLDSAEDVEFYGRMVCLITDSTAGAKEGRIVIDVAGTNSENVETLMDSVIISSDKVRFGSTADPVDLEPTGDVYIENTQKLIFEDDSGNEAFSITVNNNNQTVLKESGSGNLRIQGDRVQLFDEDTTVEYLRGGDNDGIKIYGDNKLRMMTGEGTHLSSTVTDNILFYTGEGTASSDNTMTIKPGGVDIQGDSNGTDVNIEGTGGPVKLNVTNTYTGGTEWDQAAGIEIGSEGKSHLDLKNPSSDDFDMRVMHDGNSYVISATGNMAIKTTDGNTGGRVLLQEGLTTKLQTTDDGIDVTGTVTTDGLESSGDVKLTSNNQLLFGDDESFQIWQGSSNSIIKETNNSKDLVIQGNVGNLRDDGGSDLLRWSDADGIQIYDTGGTERLQATTSGIDVTGVITAEGLDLPDDDKIRLGTGNDMEIFHDGSAGEISNSAAGGLALRSVGSIELTQYSPTEKMLEATPNSSVDLYFNNLLRLSTTDDGVEVFSDDGGVSAGPILNLRRDSSSPADNDILGAVLFSGDNSTGGPTQYAKIEGRIRDVTNGSETGEIYFKTLKDGAESIPVLIGEDSTTFNTPIIGHIKTTIESSTTDKNATGTLALANSRTVYTGSSTTTWTLPQVSAGSAGATLSIVNAGAGAITLDRDTNTIKILDGTTVSAGNANVIIATGGVVDLVVTGTNEFVCYGSGIST
jgi:hypothetical protein